MLQEWRGRFESHIIERGYSLYYNGLVTLQKKQENRYYFIVKEKYHVFIALENNRIGKVKCSCPQGKKHSLCKHIAACLIYLENLDMPFDIPHIDTLITKLSEEEKNQLLRKALSSDMDLLKTLWQSNLSSEAFQGYMLNQIFLDYGCGKDDDIVFEKRLFELMEGLNITKPEITFHHLKHLLLRLEDLRNDESYTNYVGIENRALEILATLLNQKAVANDIFEFLSTHLKQDSYLDFLFDYFRYEPYTSQKLILIDRCIQKIQHFESWAKDYYLEFYHLKKLMALYDKQDVQAIQKISKQYWHYPKIREFWIEEALVKKDYPKAISLLEESLEIDRDYKNLCLKYLHILVNIFEITQDERFKPLFRHILFKEDPGDFEDYLRYKSLCSKKEWLVERELLLKVPMQYVRLLDILLAEKMYPELMSVILKENDFYYLERHLVQLEKACPNLLIGVFKEFIERLMAKAHTKNEYIQIVSLLYKMQNYPKGDREARNIATSLATQYPKRKALIQLLEPFFL